MRLKALGLLDMERLEVAEPGVVSNRCSAFATPSSVATLKPFASVRYVKYARLIRSF
jgi:hypothetical protein